MTTSTDPEIPKTVARIRAAVEGDPTERLDDGTFRDLALEAFRLQARHLPPLRGLLARRGLDPETVDDPWEAPPIPVAAFRTLELAVAPAVEVFRSSGTTGGGRSVHRHPFPDLYRATIEASFPRACLPAPRPAVLSLVPPRKVVPDSSLGFMIDHVLRHFAGADTVVAIGANGLDVDGAERWLRRRREDCRPALVLATTFALLEWLDRRPEAGQSLPERSVVFETGGFKGRTREVSRDELAGLVESRLGVPRELIVREYGMTELTSQLYTRALGGGDPYRFVPEPWMRVRAVDPTTLEPRPPGAEGVLAFLDLANVGSALHLLTQDLGSVDAEGGVRLAGRAEGADLRGCSLTAEELLGGSRRPGS